MRARYWWSSLLVAGLAACSSSGTATLPSPTPSAASPTPSPTAAADPAAVHADELGRVPVLMYHQLLAAPKGDYDQTPAQFRAELEQLYRSGYRTVTAADLVAGTIDVPAGRSPMVLTFDDSSESQYGELPDGSVDPATATGILLEVGRKYEERPVATFYVNADPFGGHPSYLKALADLGMELGDHTATHANLRQLDPAGVQRELLAGQRVITAAVPGEVTTMALPFGAHPHDVGLAHAGSGYSFAGVLLVGSGPARSPYSRLFEPFEVPRIRSGLRTGDQAFTSTYWLPKLTATRFVSDGDPSVVSFPRARAADLSPRLRGRARPY